MPSIKYDAILIRNKSKTAITAIIILLMVIPAKVIRYIVVTALSYINSTIYVDNMPLSIGN
jgi:hypothetical protein